MEREQSEKTTGGSSARSIDEGAIEEIKIRKKNVLLSLFSNKLILNL